MTDHPQPDPARPYHLGFKDRLRVLREQWAHPPNDFRHYETAYQGIAGWLSRAQAQWLFNQAKRTDVRGDLVEIGSAYGRSTVCMGWGLKISDNGRVYAVDPHSGGLVMREQMEDANAFSSLDAFKSNIRRFGLQRFVQPVVMTSEDAIAELPDVRARLVFVDGWHSYEAARADILGWSPKVVPGGIVAVHDYLDEGVRNAVKDSLETLGLDPSSVKLVDQNMACFQPSTKATTSFGEPTNAATQQDQRPAA